ncbi:hypothetical protein BDP27DRAFT_1336187 [Rhodocollybia butyracea]|uniref:Uncharacterized protein n=1 Tax=Rhodocollybia butyracea TaxID=206335 RepID=A0A9P5PCT6_9AGAR|nr:hypothetical protein BDP27DRAFT_1336187 [Rhodocollybia butyracea]
MSDSENGEREAEFTDRNADIPPKLQARLNSWIIKKPKSQFSVYGPLNAYLQGVKFPADDFIVKPQPRLRQEDETPANNFWGGQEPNSDNSGSEDAHSAASYDSQGAAVVDEKGKFPDFTICQYGDNSNNIIRIVVEIASEGSSSAQAFLQLRDYMNLLGDRWEEKVLGIVWVGTSVALIHNGRNKRFPAHAKEWFSFEDGNLVSALDDMLKFCLP